jgi:hypothetical protein
MLIKQQVNRLTASAYSLAADYKFQRLDRHYAWDRFIIERNLRPEMDAKVFYQLFDAAHPCELVSYGEHDFQPTHLDTIVDPAVPVQIEQRKDRIFYMVWANGMTGSNPPCYPPDANRFIAII